MSICFYSELDAYTGSVRVEGMRLERLVRELTLLCLLHDIVLLPPGGLVEHPLALPAFEALAPFARAGRLGTSGDPGGRPIEYVMRRAEKARDRWGLPYVIKRGGSRAAHRRVETRELEERWGAVLPEHWSVVRDVGRTVMAYLDSVRAQLRALADWERSAAARAPLVEIRRGLDDGVATLARNYLLARAATLVGEVPADDLGRVVAILQGSYFEQGTSANLKWRPGPTDDAIPRGAGPPPSNGGVGGDGAPLGRAATGAATKSLSVGDAAGEDGRIVLFPGVFARRHGGLARGTPGVRALPVGWTSRPESAAALLAALGVPVERFLALPADELRALTEEPVWRALAARVRHGAVPAELARAVRARLDARRDPRDTLHRLAPLTEAIQPPRPAPTVLPAAWQLAIQATVGSVLGEGDEPEAVRFDWLVRTLEAPGGPAVELSEAHAQLVALLVVGGEVGVSVDEIEALLRELDAMGSAPSPPAPPAPGTMAAHALRARVDQARKRLAGALAPVGLGVRVSRGRWRLVGPRVVMTRTPWALPLGRLDGWRPAWLRGQKAVAWDVLARAAPGFVRASAVARALGRDDDAAGCAYASKVVQRLRRALEAHDERWAVVGHHAGGWRIAPRLPTRAGDW